MKASDITTKYAGVMFWIALVLVFVNVVGISVAMKIGSDPSGFIFGASWFALSALIHYIRLPKKVASKRQS